MRYFILIALLLCSQAVFAQAPNLTGLAQPVTLKLIGGKDKVVNLVEIAADKIVYEEIGDPLHLVYDMPRNRVERIVNDNGSVTNLRDDPNQVLVLVKARPKPAPDSTKEQVVLKSGQTVPAKILAVTGAEVSFRKRGGDGRTLTLPTDVASLEYADGHTRNLDKENARMVRYAARKLFDLDDAYSADAYLAANFPTQTRKSLGRLYQPEELLSYVYYKGLDIPKTERLEVRFIDLSNQNLTEVPDQVRAYRRLVGLDLSNNKLKDFPSQLLDMPNLQYIWLDSNQLREIKPDYDVSKKSNLIYLSVRGNNLTELHPSIANLGGLYCLRAGANRISKIRNKYDGAAQGSLALLDLSHNQLEFLPFALAAFPQIAYLNCTRNIISKPPAEVAPFKKLNSLILTGNTLPSISDALLSAPRLEILRLDYTPLTTLPAATTTTLLDVWLPAGFSALPQAVVQGKRLKRLHVAGLPGTGHISWPTASTLATDSLDLIDLSGDANAARFAFEARLRYPEAVLRYYDTLTEQTIYSAPVSNALRQELSALAKHPTPDAASSKALADFFNRRGDFTLALQAYQYPSTGQPTLEQKLMLAEALADPANQTKMPEHLSPHTYADAADFAKGTRHLVALPYLNELCRINPTGESQTRTRNRAQELKTAYLARLTTGAQNLTNPEVKARLEQLLK